MVYQTTRKPPYDILNAPYNLGSYGFAQAAQQAAKKSEPKVTTGYVIKIATSRIPARVGGFVTVTRNFLFGLVQSLEAADVFASQLAAAQAIEYRNASRDTTSETYAIVPVKVTETPASSKQELVSAEVKGRKGFVLKKVQPGNPDHDKYVSHVSGTGMANYSSDATQAYLFPTLAEAGRWLDLRAKSSFAGFGMTFAPEKRNTEGKPARYKTVTTPSSRTVELI